MAECDIDRIVELLDAGEFLWTDLCWTKGMSAWEPLSNLGQEIKAAKAFPPATATLVRAASSRRLTPVPPISGPRGGTARAYPGWLWVVAGVSVGALVGLLTTHLFPEVVLVDRPVDKVVERVEVPAPLTEAQQQAILFAKERDDAFKREVGYGSTSMIPVMGKKVKVYVSMDDVLKKVVSEESIRARVEAAFRRNGFEPVSPSDDGVFCNTLVEAQIFRADQESKVQIAGVIRLKISQYFVAQGSGVTKLAWFDVVNYESALRWNSDFFHKLPTEFEEYAIRASNDLAKAGNLPYRK